MQRGGRSQSTEEWALLSPPTWSSLSTASLCLKGSRRIQMPGEEHRHLCPGGCQREGVSDAEAALVFNQRTWSALQLSAQVMWQVIREGSEQSAVPSIIRLELPLLVSVNCFVCVHVWNNLYLTCVQMFLFLGFKMWKDKREVQSHCAGNNQDVQ